MKTNRFVPILTIANVELNIAQANIKNPRK